MLAVFMGRKSMPVQVAPENVVGRDQLIEQIWGKLKKKSLRFTAERRIGKTTVMTKMEAEPADGFVVLFLDLEGVDSPNRFTEVLLNRIRPLLSPKTKTKERFDSFLDTIGGTEVGGVIKLPERSKIGWQATLEKTLAGLCHHQSDRKIVLMFDELPYMLQKIATSEGADSRSQALTILDTLRSTRSQHGNLRMIYAGSVGLHHVVTDLRQEKLASEPLNDMPIVEIHGLAMNDAITLAQQLLKSESVQLDGVDAEQIPERLASLTDCVPFYLESVTACLAEMDRPVTLTDIDQTVRKQLTNDNDPWEMEHFRVRLDIYYRGSIKDTNDCDVLNAGIAREVLDHFAVMDQPQSIEQAWAVVKAKFSITDRRHIVRMLNSLGKDHYLISDTQKLYSFRFPLIQDWWKMAQGLDV